MKLRNIKAVIFDMDGVLIDAKEWHFIALNRALQLFGLEITRQAHLSEFDGLPTRTKLDIISRTKSLPRALHSFINQMKQIYTIEAINSHCVPNATRINALKSLKNDGYKLALCSNSISQTIEIMLEKSALTPYLSFYLSNESVENPKPSPEIYIKAIAKLNLTPREVLIVEDNKNGIIAAKGSGAFVMEISDIAEVNYENIKRVIAKCEAKEVQLDSQNQDSRDAKDSRLLQNPAQNMGDSQDSHNLNPHSKDSQ